MLKVGQSILGILQMNLPDYSGISEAAEQLETAETQNKRYV